MEKVCFVLIRIGVMTYIDGNKYNGDWMNDKENGKGKQSIKNIGILNYPSGDCYVGEFADGKRTGKGILFSE